MERGYIAEFWYIFIRFITTDKSECLAVNIITEIWCNLLSSVRHHKAEYFHTNIIADFWSNFIRFLSTDQCEYYTANIITEIWC